MSEPNDNAVEYTGSTGAMRDSLWLTNEDIPHDKDTTVTIEKINLRRGYKFKGSKGAKDTYSLVFVGKKRELRVNATIRKTLNALTGSTVASAWKGMTIALFVQQDVGRPDGTIGPAVRVRAKRLPQGAGSTNAAKAATAPAKAEIAEPATGQAEHDPIDAEFERHAEHQARLESDDGIA